VKAGCQCYKVGCVATNLRTHEVLLPTVVSGAASSEQWCYQHHEAVQLAPKGGATGDWAMVLQTASGGAAIGWHSFY
jgi:hypothetical protein